ncbi:hypothetical protein MLD38_018703 [Melastoma candidum]|uniref:Uncharacterized protein n=1 Tax=Melastoma candidum TaxID=119954 RepID=A0ACB9QV70_9MYRT|nr:hypothetical protein MLD38_018703 [Melastoma candidum]
MSLPSAAAGVGVDVSGEDSDRFQHVIVMRHGDRIDNFEPMWSANAERPWDPPLVEEGRMRAFCTGRKLRECRVGFPIHRAFVSPFLRCIQTAHEAVVALCAVDGDLDGIDELDRACSDGINFDPSKIKVAIEYGLCEMINRETIRMPPKDGDWGFNISELEAMLPAGTVNHSVDCLYKEVPHWEETLLASRSRYEQVILGLANKYPLENLLLVTHGEGVGVSVSTFMKDVTVYEVEYCAYSGLRRSVSLEGKGSVIHGNFKFFINPSQTGIRYLPNSCLSYASS